MPSELLLQAYADLIAHQVTNGTLEQQRDGLKKILQEYAEMVAKLQPLVADDVTAVLVETHATIDDLFTAVIGLRTAVQQEMSKLNAVRALKDAIDGLNAIPNTQLKSGFVDSYALVAFLERVYRDNSKPIENPGGKN